MCSNVNKKMSDQRKHKPTLPFGWIVRQSSSFPDRVYYFNVQTGATTWEMPDLRNLAQNSNTSNTSKRHSDVKRSSRKAGVNKQVTDVNKQVPDLNRQVPGVICQEPYINQTVPGLKHQDSGLSPPFPAVSHQIPGGSQYFPVEAKFSPEFSDDDDDNLDLNLNTSDNIHPSSISNNFDNQKDYRTSEKYSFLKKTNQGVSTVTKEQWKPFEYCSPSQIINKCEKKNQGEGSSAASVRSNSSSVENANRFCKVQETLASEPGIFPTKKVKLSGTGIDTKGSSSRYVLGEKDNFNSKQSLIDTAKQLPNPPDILVGTETYAMSSDHQGNNGSKVILGQKRKVKDRLGSQLCSAINRTEDSRKIDKRKVCCSPKGSEIKTDIKTIQHESGNTRTKVKKKSIGKHKLKNDNTDCEMAKTLSGDVRKVVSSSETSQCSLPLADIHDTELVARDRFNASGNMQASDVNVPSQHLTDPEKLHSIQSWIDQCELEDDLSDKSSEIFIPQWNFSSPYHDSGRDSSVPRNHSDSRRVVVTNDKLSISTGDSVLQPSGGESHRDTSTGPRNNSWKGVHATPAPVNHRNVISMEIDEWKPQPVADDDRQIEGMDVSEIALKEVREHLQKQIPNEVTGSLTECISITDSQSKLANLHQVQKLLIVLDTNVLIENLGFVEELRDQEFKELAKPLLVIPWVVMQELDALKNSKNNFSLSTARKARGPVNFLFHCFKVQHPRIIGQTPDEAKQALEEFTPECNDDRILHCCLHYKKRNPESHVILLSNDKNLCSKAAILKIQAYSRQTVVAGIEAQSKFLSSEKASAGSEIPHTPSKNPRISPIRSPRATPGSSKPLHKHEENFDDVVDQILCKAKLLIKDSLSIVLEKEMKVAFSDVWMEIVYRKPPWTLEDILDCFKKHWTAVFGMIYNRKLREEVHRLVEKFKPFKGFTPTLESVGELVDDAVKIIKECEVHSNYGILFQEASAELKLVQKFQQECNAGTISGINLKTYLNRKSIKKRLSLDGDMKTVAPSSRTESVSPPSVASSHRSPCVSDDGVIHIQPVENRFCTVWQTILNICDTMKMWVETSAEKHQQEMNDTLNKLVPFIKDLRYHFEHTLSFSPTQIKSQQMHVHDICIKLNTFFSAMEIEESCEPVEIEQVQLYFASEERRTMLRAGLQQLDEMIRSLFTFLHLLPD